MMFLSTTATTPIEEAVSGVSFDNSMIIGIIAIVAIIFIIIGLIKKTLWICIVATIIAAFLGISSPESISQFKDNIVSTFNQVIEPLKDGDYSNIINDDVIDKIGQELGDINKEQNDPSENSDK